VPARVYILEVVILGPMAFRVFQLLAEKLSPGCLGRWFLC